MTARKKYLLSLMFPIALLVISVAASPHLFSVSWTRGDLDPLPEAPALLYKRNNFSVFYTSQDLLHPEALGQAGQYYQAIAFDVWPTGEGHSSPEESLTWVRQISWALSVENAEGKPLSGVEPNDSDNQIAADFVRTLSGPPKLERARVSSFQVPSQSTYRNLTGIQTLIALAIKDPLDKLLPTLKGTPQLFAEGLAAGIEEAAKQEARGVGVPYMPASGVLGTSSSQTSSWKTILDEVDKHSRSSRIDKVVLGGWGLLPDNRERTDRAFRQAWSEWRSKLDEERGRPVHEQIRLTALVALAALAGALRRKKFFTISRLLSILVISATLALSVGAILGWVHPLMPGIASGPASLVIKAMLALLAGVFIERIVGFEPKKELQDAAGG